MPEYRPATAADVGRTDVEFSNRDNNNSWSQPSKLTQIAIGKLQTSYIANDVYAFPFARVPILPEECSHKPDTTGQRTAEQTLKAIREAWGEYIDYLRKKYPADPFELTCPHHIAIHLLLYSDTIGTNPPVHTIRRKLEAGGLAEAEQAVLIDGRYYPTEWIKSGVGVLPQQVEIV